MMETPQGLFESSLSCPRYVAWLCLCAGLPALVSLFSLARRIWAFIVHIRPPLLQFSGICDSVRTYISSSELGKYTTAYSLGDFGGFYPSLALLSSKNDGCFQHSLTNISLTGVDVILCQGD